MAKRKAKGKFSLKGLGRHKYLILGGAAIGAFFLLRGGGGNDQVALSSKMAPAGVTAGEAVSITNYRVIAEQRPGMTYAPVLQGSIPGALTFQATKGGTCTRNVVQNGGQLLVEIA